MCKEGLKGLSLCKTASGDVAQAWLLQEADTAGNQAQCLAGSSETEAIGRAPDYSLLGFIAQDFGFGLGFSCTYRKLRPMDSSHCLHKHLSIDL